MVGIVGKSGSGKSTLLAILGGYAVPSAGKVQVACRNLLALSTRLRQVREQEWLAETA